jgi:peptidoglycan hydrolase-like protein with peptidoglycan-binding domain
LGEEESIAEGSVQMPSNLRNLSLNKQGKDVESLQARLTELGY